MSEEIKHDDFVQAIDRLAHTEDGRLLYLYLQRTLCGVTTDDSALHRQEGRRSLAAELMGLMAKGIRESGRSAEPVVTFVAAGAARASPGSGPGRIRAYLAAQSGTEPDANSGAG